MKNSAFTVVAVSLLIVAFSVACASAAPTAPPTFLPTSIPPPTSTLVPTLTPSSQPTATSASSPTPTMLPTRTPTLTASQRYQSAFGIDYGHPEKYLAQGEQTRLSNPAIIDSLRGQNAEHRTSGRNLFLDQARVQRVRGGRQNDWRCHNRSTVQRAPSGRLSRLGLGLRVAPRANWVIRR